MSGQIRAVIIEEGKLLGELDEVSVSHIAVVVANMFACLQVVILSGNMRCLRGGNVFVHDAIQYTNQQILTFFTLILHCPRSLLL